MDINKIPLGTPEEFNVLVEIPTGSANKYELDESTGFITLDFVFKDGLVYPFNYGSIPHTRAEDGDMLDAAVFSSQPIPPNTVVKVKTFGMLKLKDRGEQDNKILAVPLVDPLAKELDNIVDFTESQQKDFENFWLKVAEQKNKVIILEGFFGKQEAMEEVKKSEVK